MPIFVIFKNAILLHFIQYALDMIHLHCLKTISCQYAFTVSKTKIQRMKYILYLQK